MILSNEAKLGLKEKIRKFNLGNIFEKIYCSANIGIAKPATRIFEHVMSDVSAKAADFVLIDDWHENIKAVYKLGMRGILYKDAYQLKRELVMSEFSN